MFEFSQSSIHALENKLHDLSRNVEGQLDPQGQGPQTFCFEGQVVTCNDAAVKTDEDVSPDEIRSTIKRKKETRITSQALYLKTLASLDEERTLYLYIYIYIFFLHTRCGYRPKVFLCKHI